MPAVSSTEIRDRLAGGKSVAGLVPRGVLDYIYGRRLYHERA
jgi:nicotinate-nucleotide adenylyltransferase